VIHQTERLVRVVVVGTGTSVGKTWLSCALLRRAHLAGRNVLGLKPVESGAQSGFDTDGALLARAANSQAAAPPYLFVDAVSPHLAAARARTHIDLSQSLTYVQTHESSPRPRGLDLSLVETAGGLFSPLAPGLTNFDFAMALEPARWLLVAPDALGVLHDLTATLEVCRARGRAPDAIALCQARGADASTGTNADEISRLRIAARPFVFAADSRDDPALDQLLAALLGA
jgi:dethiobiotin synthetase